MPSSTQKVINGGCFQDRLCKIPPAYQRLFRSVYEGKAVKVARLKAKCLECSAYQRIEITHCTVFFCPLWAVRPYQIKTVKKTDNEQG